MTAPPPAVSRALPTSSWETAPLGAIAELKIGRTPARADARYWRDGTVPWVSIADMSNGRLSTTKERISQDAMNETFGGKLAPAGTLLMSFKLTIGKLAILDVPATHNEAIVGIYPDAAILVRDFLFYALQSINLTADQDSYVKGNTLNKDKLSQLRIPLPPLDEQRRIAGILSTIQRSGEACARQFRATLSVRRSLVEQLFAARPDWASVSIGDLAETSSGATPRRQEAANYGGGIPWVKSGEVRDGVISVTAETISEQGLLSCSSHVLPAGTLVIAMYGATAGQVGILGIDAATNQAICAIRPRSDRVTGEYLFFALQHHRERLRAERFGGAQPNLSQQIIRAFQLPIPDQDTQARVVRVLSTVDTSARRLAAQQVAVERLYSSTLQQLIEAAR